MTPAEHALEALGTLSHLEYCEDGFVDRAPLDVEAQVAFAEAHTELAACTGLAVTGELYASAERLLSIAAGHPTTREDHLIARRARLYAIHARLTTAKET